MKHPANPAQRGTVLLLTLIVLVVLLLGGVALVRSFDTTLLTAGNIAFKRDLVNQGERVVPRVLQLFETGVLNTAEARGANNKNNNYSAAILASSPQGVPLALLDNNAFTAIGATTNDIVLQDLNQNVKIRYVIDRMCNAAGLDATLGAAGCIQSDSGLSDAVDLNHPGGAEFAGPDGKAGAVPQQVVYRISVRVDGPRNTQTFLQTTFSL
jgi:type IV pilus assembly protein PilX